MIKQEKHPSIKVRLQKLRQHQPPFTAPPQLHLSTSPCHTQRQNILHALGEGGPGISQGLQGHEDVGMPLKASTGTVFSTSNPANGMAAPCRGGFRRSILVAPKSTLSEVNAAQWGQFTSACPCIQLLALS